MWLFAQTSCPAAVFAITLKVWLISLAVEL